MEVEEAKRTAQAEKVVAKEGAAESGLASWPERHTGIMKGRSEVCLIALQASSLTPVSLSGLLHQFM